MCFFSILFFMIFIILILYKLRAALTNVNVLQWKIKVGLWQKYHSCTIAKSLSVETRYGNHIKLGKELYWNMETI